MYKQFQFRQEREMVLEKTLFTLHKIWRLSKFHLSSSVDYFEDTSRVGFKMKSNPRNGMGLCLFNFVNKFSGTNAAIFQSRKSFTDRI